MIEREVTAPGLHDTETKYATQKTDVFRKKDRREISPRCNPSITADLSGVHISTPPVPQGPDQNILTSMQEDISWLDTTVSVLFMEDISGGALHEARDQDMEVAVLQELKHNYGGIEYDEKGRHTDIVKNTATGLFIKEMPSVRSSMVSKIGYMLQSKGVPHRSGAVVLENMNEQDVAKDEETPQSTPWSSAAL